MYKKKTTNRESLITHDKDDYNYMRISADNDKQNSFDNYSVFTAPNFIVYKRSIFISKGEQ